MGALTDYAVMGEISLSQETISNLINIATGIIAHKKMAKISERAENSPATSRISNNQPPVNHTPLTKESAIKQLIGKLQNQTSIFEIRNLIEFSSNRQDGRMEFYDANSKTKYFIHYDLNGNIIKYQTFNKDGFSYYKYDKDGHAIKVDQIEYNGINSFIRENTDYILSHTEIPQDVAQLMLQNDYAFNRSNIDEMLSLIKAPEDWEIVKKVLSTKGSPTVWKRTIGSLIGANQTRFTATDVVEILKSEDAKQYVRNCISNNSYCNKEKLRDLVSMSGVSKSNISDRENLIYKTEDLTIENVADVIKEFRTNPNVRDYIISKIPDGEVGNINGKLFCRSGNKLTELNISKETFELLFPISERYKIKQGNVGDCWLISDICGSMSTPEGRMNIYSMFREENGNIFVKLPNDNIEVCFNFEEWKKLKTNGLKSAPYGIRMIEQTVAFNRKYSSDIPTTKYANNKQEINEALNSLEGNTIGAGLSYIIPNNDHKHCMFYDVSGNNYYKSQAQQRQDLNIILSEIDDFMRNNSNSICPIEFKKGFTIDGYNIDPNHACRITGYDSTTQRVKIINPHNGNREAEIPLDLFIHTAGMINLYDITTEVRTYNFSAKKLDNSGAIYL